ncbi:MAG: UvrB/UvrC motif-containing protein [Patescibacteria group bacterium]|nr:UvrB/UvrC motif-containing protein [Patescibacteria group bacterium]
MLLADFEKRKKKIPDTPGVYFFLGSRKEVLYIGKAASLRDRTRSYFAGDLAYVRSPSIASMVAKARFLDWRQTDSVLEALILEANLIKSHKPKFNTLEKDDKSFNYVVITEEKFPQILRVRGKELAREKGNRTFKIKAVFGPFPHGTQLKEALRIIRKIFPYRDEKCTPGQGRPCFNRQLGLCPGVCTGEVSAQEYARAVRHLVLFFQGKKKALLRELQREMKKMAKEERFEKAAGLRRQIFALQHIQDVSLIKEEYRAPSASGAYGYRIEAYDTAHFQGRATVGAMVVVENGVQQKSEYRTFHIRGVAAGDDTGALREMLSRRLAHDEWSFPKLIVVDGSKAQMNAALKVLEEGGIRIPVVGVIKNEKHKPRGIAGDPGLIRMREQDILLANAEAHRFAITRHRRRSRRMLTRA